MDSELIYFFACFACGRGTVWRLLLGYLPAHRDRRPATLQRKRGEYAGILPQYFGISSEERTLQEQVWRGWLTCCVYVVLLGACVCGRP